MQPHAHHTNRRWGKIIFSGAAPYSLSLVLHLLGIVLAVSGRGLSSGPFLSGGSMGTESFFLFRVPLATGASRGRKERG